MADLGRMVVVVEVYENEVKYLRLGQPAVVTSKAFPPPYDEKGLQGKVTRIGPHDQYPVAEERRSVCPGRSARGGGARAARRPKQPSGFRLQQLAGRCAVSEEGLGIRDWGLGAALLILGPENSNP